MKIKLSIYKAKKISDSIDQVLNLERVKSSIEFENEKARMYLYAKEYVEPQVPEWATLFINANLDLGYDFFGKNSNTGAVLVVELNDERYLIPFGTGHHLINDNYIVKGFGLKTTLNCIEHKKIRSIDKGNHNETNLLTRNQSSKEVDIYNLKIDSELDILTTLTGTSTEEVLGNKITGRDAFVITPDVVLNSIPDLLEKISDIYSLPLPEEFEWVNNIQEADESEIEILDLLLIDLIKAKDFSDIWLGEPEIVDWESQIGYCFEKRQRSIIYESLSMNHVCDFFEEKEIEITVDNLKEKNIHILDADYQSIKKWSIYRCLYAEIKNGDQNYILRDSIWYVADRKFLSTIDDEISKILPYENADKFPIYSFKREEDYNSNICGLDVSFTHMDQKFIHHGSGKSKIEFCDLIRGSNDFIHVKYYNGSQSMSHLFSQGFISSELFISDSEFREKLNDKLPVNLKLKDHILRPDARNYKIIFAIATNKNIPNELPLFSKINLKNFYKSISNFGYEVRICKIPVDDLIYKKKSYRPKNN
ncbi:TIGR04141 family sporadically distributed protein [Pectobacterium actinidiae]|uniref:TIGR04141 family sporadically distributed protein n=1 Tax=Pectobacterium actinidiae TaxID=1507808 RepID=UPI002A83B93B|nr:TIGR04141 family sporadically distributed protein [Pectobacterium actinidiae]MDY4317117.1 TIGR04141 family sporadically distributed protein [Pectobacterium actinidiae]